MSHTLIERFIHARVKDSGMIETGIKGVQLFKLTEPVRCAPAIYEPSITAILSGSKEAIWHGKNHLYDNSRYICCTMPMPIEAGAPHVSPENPLLGVYVSIDTQVMTELVLEIESTRGVLRMPGREHSPSGILTSVWDNSFTEALTRLLLLTDNPIDLAVLYQSRLREFYYAVLNGEAGHAFRCTFGVENKIARSIAFLSSHLGETITIEDMADSIGMSRAVFHRKFKQATNMSPIQFIKSMRLNNAAKRISEGASVNLAALEVGYSSVSQFSREFKRLYGASPKQWSQANIKVLNESNR